MCLIASCPLSGKMTDDEYSPNNGSKKKKTVLSKKENGSKMKV